VWYPYRGCSAILEGVWDTLSMDMATIIAGAVKSDRLGHVKGYLVRFGGPEAHDLEGDYFTAATDFGFPVSKGQRIPLNVYYHHGMDPQIGRKSIGTGYVKLTDEGLWYEAQLDMADEYAAMVAKLCKEGKMGYSSGAAGHLVERKSVGSASEITRWPIAEASITPTPAEWRNTVKSLPEMYGEMPEMDEAEMPEIEEPMAGEDPTQFAAGAFAEAPGAIFHEGLESLYEMLCGGIMAVAEIEGNKAPFVVALVDAFADRAKALLDGINIDAKALRPLRPDTLRTTERRLRDAVGLSRSDAKRLAPDIWDALRDAGQTKDTDTIDEPEVKASDDKRREMLERILWLELMK